MTYTDDCHVVETCVVHMCSAQQVCETSVEMVRQAEQYWTLSAALLCYFTLLCMLPLQQLSLPVSSIAHCLQLTDI